MSQCNHELFKHRHAESVDQVHNVRLRWSFRAAPYLYQNLNLRETSSRALKASATFVRLV